MEAQGLWGMLYADDAGIISRSPGGIENMMTVIVTRVLGVRAHGLRSRNGDYLPANNCLGKVLLAISAAGQGHKHMIECVRFDGAIKGNRGLSVEITRRLERAWASSGIR